MPAESNSHYTYDYRNRLTLVEYDNGDDVVSYLYDGYNRRIKKDLETGTDVVYFYDGWGVVEEKDNVSGGWNTRRQFVYGEPYDELLIFDNDADGDGTCTDVDNDTRYLYCQNITSNVMALTDSAGDVVERYDYEPYGNFTVALDNASGNPYRFQGQRYDDETGLYYFRNRYYHPDLGRFLQREALGYVDGFSLYEALASAPTIHVDLSLPKTSSGRERVTGSSVLAS